MRWPVPLPRDAVMVGVTVATALDTPTAAPLLKLKPRASTEAEGSALARIERAAASISELLMLASMVGVNDAAASEPAAAAPMSPKLTEVTSTLDVALLVSCASTLRLPVTLRSLAEMVAFVVEPMVARVRAPPPLRETLKAERLTLMAEACAVALTVASSVACTVTPPEAPSRVVETRFASTRFWMVLSAIATPIDNAPEPILPTLAATEAAPAVAVIVDASVAVIEALLPISMWLLRLVSMAALILLLMVLVVSEPAPAAATATTPPATATAADSTVARIVAVELAVT